MKKLLPRLEIFINGESIGIADVEIKNDKGKEFYASWGGYFIRKDEEGLSTKEVSQ